jgi:hypothetical protein
MRNRKLISMFLLPAALVACNNDEFISDFNNNNAKEVVEGLTLNVSLDAGTSTRGAYAGASGGAVFQNFYLEPEYSGNDLLLSDQTALHGDMLGLCLTNGGSAITNLPFYIAGYGSTKGEGESAKTKIFTFAASTNTLYDLGLDTETQVEDDALYVGGSNAKSSIATSVSAITIKAANEPLDADVMDVRKGILRTNAGVMTGKYVAYYPYNADFVDPAGIPVKGTDTKELDAISEVTGFSDNVTAAIEAANFYKKLFACSNKTVDVAGGTKSGDVSLTPVTGAVVFKVWNTAGADSKAIKLITIKATENSAATDFALNGTMKLGTTNTFVAGDKTTDMIGVSLSTPAEVTGNTAVENAKYIMMPIYSTADKKVSISVYTTDKKVATIEKNSIPGNGKAVTYTIDMNDLTFADAPQYVYNEKSFKEAAAAEGTLIMLADITVSSESEALNLNNKLTIQGNHTLTVKKGTNDASISASLTFEEGAKLVLDGAVAVTKPLTCGELTLKGEPTFTGTSVTATTLNIEAGANITTLGDAVIGTLNNKGTLATVEVAGKKVSVTTLNNEGTVTVNADTELAAGTLNNKAVASSAASVTVTGKLTATTVVNEAATAPGVIPALLSGEITVTGETSAATVSNAGTLTWNSAKDMNLKVTNSGTFSISEVCNFTGTLDNSGTATFAETKVITGTAGTINNSGDMTVNGSLILTGTTLNIKAGKVNNVGNISGATKIIVTEGAEFVKTVSSYNELINALGTSGVPAKFTGVNVASAIVADAAVSTEKKVYLAQNLTLNEASTLNGDVVVTANATLTATKATTISAVTVNSSVTLTIGENSNITVTGNITNNGTYKHDTGAVVYCAGIDGTGTWTNYPTF